MRIKRGNVCRNRHKKILKLAKGFKGARSRIFKVANIAVMKALKYAYRDRRATLKILLLAPLKPLASFNIFLCLLRHTLPRLILIVQHSYLEYFL